jgi:hypothetical protein
LSRILLLGLLKLSPLILFLLPPLFCLLLSSPVLLLSSPVLLLLSQPLNFLLLSSAVLSFVLCLSSSSKFFDGKLGRLSRHGWDDDDDETKPSSTLTFIRLGSVHGPIMASRAQPKKGDTVRVSPSCTPVGSEWTLAVGTQRIF